MTEQTDSPCVQTESPGAHGVALVSYIATWVCARAARVLASSSSSMFSSSSEVSNSPSSASSCSGSSRLHFLPFLGLHGGFGAAVGFACVFFVVFGFPVDVATGFEVGFADGEVVGHFYFLGSHFLSLKPLVQVVHCLELVLSQTGAPARARRLSRLVLGLESLASMSVVVGGRTRAWVKLMVATRAVKSLLRCIMKEDKYERVNKEWKERGGLYCNPRCCWLLNLSTGCSPFFIALTPANVLHSPILHDGNLTAATPLLCSGL